MLIIKNQKPFADLSSQTVFDTFCLHLIILRGVFDFWRHLIGAMPNENFIFRSLILYFVESSGPQEAEPIPAFL